MVSVERERPAFPAHPVMALPAPIPPPPIEDGCVLGPPDFVGIGAMRSGTTWWFAIMKRHPGVASSGVPRSDAADADPKAYVQAENAKAYVNKEFHFFDHYGRVATVDPAEYHRYFPRLPGQLAGEWTPRYIYDFWTPPMLWSVAPDARILVLLRDPVERFVSGVGRFTSLGFTADAALCNEQFSRGLYWQQLANVLSYYPREQVLVLQYEKCVRDFVGQAHRTFEFLGLDPADWSCPPDPRAPIGIVANGHRAVNAATRDAVRRAYQADIRRLLADFPELDGALWPSA